MNSLSFGVDTFDELLMLSLSEYCPQLQSLEINFSPMMKRTTIDFSTCFLSRQYVTSLTDLTIRNSKKMLFPLTVRQIGKVPTTPVTPEDPMTNIVLPGNLCLDLRSLRLENCIVEGGTVFGLIRFTDRLEMLSLRGSDSTLWNKIDISQLTNLTHLDISHTNFVNVAEKTRLESLSNLTELNMSCMEAFPFGSTIFKTMMENNTNLTKLDVSSCKMCSHIISPNVRHLVIQNSNINDQQVTELFDNLPQVTHLDISLSSQIRTPVIKSNKLNSLIMANCENLAEILYVPSGAPSLTELDVSHSKIQDFTLTTAVKLCGGELTRLNCAGCPLLFSPAFTDHQYSLLQIDFSQCYNLAHKAVETLVQMSPHLQAIDITGCEWVSGQQLREMTYATTRKPLRVIQRGLSGMTRNLNDLKVELPQISSSFEDAPYYEDDYESDDSLL
jgi:hypothetical protein